MENVRTRKRVHTSAIAQHNNSSRDSTTGPLFLFFCFYQTFRNVGEKEDSLVHREEWHGRIREKNWGKKRKDEEEGEEGKHAEPALHRRNYDETGRCAYVRGRCDDESGAKSSEPSELSKFRDLRARRGTAEVRATNHEKLLLPGPATTPPRWVLWCFHNLSCCVFCCVKMCFSWGTHSACCVALVVVWCCVCVDEKMIWCCDTRKAQDKQIKHTDKNKFLWNI